MASKDLSVGLQVSATTVGEESIRNLADDVRALAKTAGDAAPQFKTLADELADVADTAAAVKTLQDVAEATTNAQQRVDSATTSYRTAREAYESAAAALADLKTQQNAASDAVSAARTSATAATEAYKLLRAEVQSHAERTDEDRISLSNYNAAQVTATANLQRATQAYKELSPAVRDAQTEANALLSASNKQEAQLAKTTAALNTQTAAQVQAADAARALGVDTDNLAAAQVKLLESQQVIAASAEQLQTALAEQAGSDRLAVVQQNALAEAYRAGQAELQALARTYSDAEASAKAYDAELAQQDLLHAEFYAATLEMNEALAQQRTAQLAAAEATAEQAESDRLAIVQINSMFEARQRGQAELQAEIETLNEYAAAEAAAAAETAKATAATLALAAAAEEARTALDEAFSATGVRSLAEINAEIQEVEQSMSVLRANFEAGAISAQDLARGLGGAIVELEALRDEAATIPALSTALENVAATVNGLISTFAGLGAAVATIGFAVKPILDANIQLEQMRRILTEVYGSVDAANQQIALLQQAADKSGISISALSSSFQTFSAAAHSAGLSTQLVQQVFTNTVGAAGQLGLSGEKVTLILEALGQMANKGVVSMEELRRQLGNSLPGALTLMAQGLGITNQQLTKLVSSGQLLSSEALPAIASAMSKIGAQGAAIDGLQQSFARLGNAVTLTEQEFSKTDAYKDLNSIISTLAANFDTVVHVATALGEIWAANKVVGYLQGVAQLNTSMQQTAVVTEAATVAATANTAAEVEATAAVAADTVAREANVAAVEAQTAAMGVETAAAVTSYSQIGSAATKGFQVVEGAVTVGSRAVTALGNAAKGALAFVGGLPGVLALVALNAKALGDGLASAIFNMTAAGKQAAVNAQQLADLDAKTRAAYDASQLLSDGFVKLQAQYTLNAGNLAKQVDAANKHVEAVKAETAANNTLADITGSLNVKVDTATKGAAAYAAASQASADVLKLQADATSSLIDAATRDANVQGVVNTALLQQIDTYKQKLIVQQASAEKAQAEADAARLSADQTVIASAAVKDNAAQLDVLRQNYLTAQAAANQYTSVVKDGVVTLQQNKAAIEAAAVAQGLYNTALNNVATNAERANAAVQNSVSVQTAATNSTIAFYQAEKAQALAIGNTTAARQADISIARAQGDLLQEQLTVKRADIALTQSQIAVLQSKIAAGEGDTRAEQAALDALRAKLAVEQQETSTLDSNIQTIDAQTQALEQNTGATTANTSAKTANAAADKLDAARAAGPTPVDNTGAQDIENKVKAGTLSSSDLAEVTAALNAAKGNLAGSVAANKIDPGAVDQSGINSDESILRQLQAAMDSISGSAATFAKAATPAPAPAATASPSAAPSTASPQSTSHTVTVNLGGQSTTISTASAADASSLSALVQQLATAASRAQ
jgi:tape measure domain-containing protein